MALNWAAAKRMAVQGTISWRSSNSSVS